MARAATVVETAPEVDRLDGLPLPREQTQLYGHRREELELLDAYRSGRIHHGWILGGVKGAGKATLAFRFARFVLTHPDPEAPEVLSAVDLSVDPELAAARRVMTGSHGNILHLKRPWDEKAKRFRTELPIDEIRRTVGFFGTTAAEGGWRIAIVDPADDMNANAANALLKVLEEPPARSLFLVIANHPGRVLPTIRSRCRKLILAPLSPAEVRAGLVQLGLGESHDASALAAAADLSDGSIRRAVLLLELGGIRIWKTLSTIVAGLPALDLKAVHTLADAISMRGADDTWDMTIEFIARIISDKSVTAADTDLALAARWAVLHDTMLQRVGSAEALNLDKKSLVLWMFRALVDVART